MGRNGATHDLGRREVLKLLGAGSVGLMVASRHSAAATPKRGGTYRMGRVQDILNFNPTQLSAGNEPMLYQVFDTLVRIDDDFKLEPRLAESWRFSRNPSTRSASSRCFSIISMAEVSIWASPGRAPFISLFVFPYIRAKVGPKPWFFSW